MRAIYLIRHGEPAFPEGEKTCLGRLDLPLSGKGRAEASLLEPYLAALPDVHVYSSPLARCMESAKCAGQPDAIPLEDLAEISMGEWDGLSFENIRNRWPDLYAKRGEDLLNTAPPGGESFFECSKRSRRALDEIRKSHPAGDLVIFTHSGVIKTLAAYLTGAGLDEYLEKQYPYGSVAMFLETKDADAGTAWKSAALEGPVFLPGDLPYPFPDQQECIKLLQESGTPQKVCRHCIAAAKKALELYGLLQKRGVCINREAVYAGAMLHDIDRVSKHHAYTGAERLLAKGFLSLASIVGDHMALPLSEERISEKSIVFLADKLIKDTREVTLEERYFQNITPEKEAYVRLRYEQAVRISKLIFG